MALKVISLNVRGIGDVYKRRSIFNYYRQRGNIICLQETHSTTESEMLWRSEWGGDIIFSHGSSKARGVCVLMPKGMMNSVRNINIDNAGRAVKFELEIQEKIVTFCGIYAPNEDKPSFFMKIFEMVAENPENIIIVGDFNLVMNPDIDRLGDNISKDQKYQSRDIIDKYAEELFLVDLYRCKNPESKRYSWYRTKPKLIASRLDFALVSHGFVNINDNCGYITGIHTDHLAFYAYFTLTRNPRGKGYWKMNVEHLKNVEYVNMMNESLDLIIENSKHLDTIQRWEFLKYRVREITIEFSKNAVSDRELLIAQLSEKICEMEEELKPNMLEILENTRKDLEDIMFEKTKGCIFRAKARYQEYGERPTKYFFGLEKARYNAKTCSALYDKNDNLVTSTEGILKLQEEFYKELYTRDSTINFKMTNEYDIQVPEHLRKEMSEPLTMKEISTAVLQLANNKVCGNDGIPIDFYKVFWKKIQNLFLEVLEENQKQMHLHNSALLGVISMIPKANRDTRRLEFLRPITLLNSDYKVVEKMLANRIIPALEHIINSDQRGFMKSRRICSNIRTIFELIKYTKEEDIEAILLSLDFMKCFDRIEFNAIYGALNFFEFPEWIINWVKIIYTGFKVNTLNNGHFSNRFKVGRGLHQGGPCSSILFLICAETMALMLRSNQQIQGISVRDFVNLLGQYADDADIYQLFKQESIDNTFLCLEKFRSLTGFTINYDKTMIMRIGSIRNSNAMLFTQKYVAWTNDAVNILGVWVGTNIEEVMDKNYNKNIEKSKATLLRWKNRSMSLLGKVLIINSLIMSLFVYKMMVLPKMKNSLIKQLYLEIEKFIWNGAKPKVNTTMLCRAQEQGGVKLINYTAKDKSLKLTWPQILLQEPKLKALVYENIGNPMGDNLWSCDINPSDVKDITSDEFWNEVLSAWFELKQKIEKPNEVKERVIWWNSKIRMQGKTIIWRKCVSKGLLHITQLYNDGRLKSFIELNGKYGLTLMEMKTLISAIPIEWKKMCQTQTEHVVGDNYMVTMLNKKNLAAYAYNRLIEEEVNPLKQKIEQWENELNTNIRTDQMERCLKNIYVVTNYPKLRSFQYRLIQRAIVNNVHLNRWGIKETDLCTFCNGSAETYTHLFIMCEHVRELWIKLEQYMEKYNCDTIDFKVDKVLMNLIIENPKNVKNFMCLLLKQYIYRKRCYGQKPQFEEFKKEIEKTRKIELYIAKKNDKESKHFIKWNEASPKEPEV